MAFNEQFDSPEFAIAKKFFQAQMTKQLHNRLKTNVQKDVREIFLC